MTVLIHAAAWMLLFSLPFLLRTSHNQSEMKPQPENPTFMFVMQVVSDVLLIIIFYLNAIILIPRFLYKRKYAWYTLSLIICLAIFVLAIWELWINFSNHIEFSFETHLLISSFIFIFIIACSTAYKMIRDKFIADQLAKEKETEHLKTELSLLRSQASPHFMFNVLNNMVALARKHSDELAFAY